MAYKITLIPGDGIGPEVTQAAVRILEATGVKFEWEIYEAGAQAYEKYGEYIPKELIHSIERTGIGLKGPVTTPVGTGFQSIRSPGSACSTPTSTGDRMSSFTSLWELRREALGCNDRTAGKEVIKRQ